MISLLRSVASALGGDFLAADLFETPGGLLVNEVNDGAEFRNSIAVTGTDIPGALIGRCLHLAGFGRAAA
jgi:[lysine-biosynthesis-protein LysW]--L-2-aminoadipate ligase